MSMQNIVSYLYRAKIECEIFEPMPHFRRTIRVYARNLRAYKGVTNKFLIEVKNQDQKPINIASRIVRMHVLNEVDGSSLISKTASTYNAARGQALVVLDENDLLDFEQNIYNYTISVINGEGEHEIAYADDHYGVRNNIEILGGHYPEFRASTELSFDSVTGLTSGVGLDATVHRGTKFHTAQFYLSDFTGMVEIQGTMDPVPNLNNANYFVIKTETYSAAQGCRYTNWQGNYSAVRFRLVPASGAITQVLYRD